MLWGVVGGLLLALAGAPVGAEGDSQGQTPGSLGGGGESQAHKYRDLLDRPHVLVSPASSSHHWTGHVLQG